MFASTIGRHQITNLAVIWSVQFKISMHSRHQADTTMTKELESISVFSVHHGKCGGIWCFAARQRWYDRRFGHLRRDPMIWILHLIMVMVMMMTTMTIIAGLSRVAQKSSVYWIACRARWGQPNSSLAGPKCEFITNWTINIAKKEWHLNESASCAPNRVLQNSVIYRDHDIDDAD